MRFYDVVNILIKFATITGSVRQYNIRRKIYHPNGVSGKNDRKLEEYKDIDHTNTSKDTLKDYPSHDTSTKPIYYTQKIHKLSNAMEHEYKKLANKFKISVFDTNTHFKNISDLFGLIGSYLQLCCLNLKYLLNNEELIEYQLTKEQRNEYLNLYVALTEHFKLSFIQSFNFEDTMAMLLKAGDMSGFFHEYETITSQFSNEQQKADNLVNYYTRINIYILNGIFYKFDVSDNEEYKIYDLVDGIILEERFLRNEIEVNSEVKDLTKLIPIILSQYNHLIVEMIKITY